MKKTKAKPHAASATKYLPILAILALLLVFLIGVYFLKNPSTKSTSGGQKDMSTSPQAELLTYKNTKYGYTVDYPASIKSFGEPKDIEETTAYGHTDFASGCFVVLTVPAKYTETRKDIQRIIAAPYAKLNELEKAVTGKTLTYLGDRMDMGNGKYFDIQFSFKKLPNKQIGNVDWSAFEVTNNFENHGIRNMYFTHKNNYDYIINMLSSGPCPETEPGQMVDSFKFLP